MTQLWRSEYKDKVLIVAGSTEPTCEPDEFDLWERDNSIITKIDDEFDTFITSTPILIRGSALDWWLHSDQAASYPNLSRMAVDILSIPAMSAEPERVFSGARRTITWDRMRLGATVIEHTECLKSWIRSHITVGLRKVEDGKRLEAAIESYDDGGDGELRCGTTTPCQASG